MHLICKPLTPPALRSKEPVVSLYTAAAYCDLHAGSRPTDAHGCKPQNPSACGDMRPAYRARLSLAWLGFETEDGPIVMTLIFYSGHVESDKVLMAAE